MVISVVGLGLIGGSIALGMKAKDASLHVIGVDQSQENAKKAVELGIADEIMELNDAVKAAEITILAVPVNIILKLIPEVLSVLPEGAILTDMGSTKDLISRSVENHPKRKQFVAGHPMAGTEWSGPEAAFKELMPGKPMILCDVEKSDPKAVETIERIFADQLEMQVSYMNSVEHDRHIAYVSHLSHISSFALSTTVLEKEKDEESIFKMASTGFSSTVRLAKSSPQMWAPIFSQNLENVSAALGAYIEQLVAFKKILDENDVEASFKVMERANEIRRVLHDIDNKGKK